MALVNISPIMYFANDTVPNLPLEQSSYAAPISLPQLLSNPSQSTTLDFSYYNNYYNDETSYYLNPYAIQQQAFNPFAAMFYQNPFNIQFNYQPLPQLTLPNYDFLSQFEMPSYTNNSFLDITKPSSTRTDKTRRQNTNTVSTYAPTGKKNLAYWKSLGYDEKMGAKLAQDAVARCPFVWDHNCVGYTRETVNAVYGTNFKKAGPGYNFGHHILDSKELKGKFKCIKINGIRPEDIPDGAILIWPETAFSKGKAAKYGHGAIAYHGKPYSDNVGCNTLKCNEIWIPVKDAA